MPLMTVHANEIIATDTIELGGAELFITDVEIDNSDEGMVHLTMTLIVPTSTKFYAYLPKHWPTTIRRK